MKKIISIALLFLATVGCNGQKNHTEEKKQPQIAAADTVGKPKVDVRVNKRYDDKGNVIQFDSTYSYFYSSPGMKRNSISSDSLFGNFKFPLLRQYQGLMEKDMNNIFFNDSMFKYDFYDSDYFSNRFHLNIPKFEELYRQMDSIKSEMFRNTYPEGTLKKKE